jgi:hypothetical protein
MAAAGTIEERFGAHLTARILQKVKYRSSSSLLIFC